jgi:hypothetical protein
MTTMTTTCPECGAPAEILDRFVLPSTDGPVEHLKARCVTGPWFVFPITSGSEDNTRADREPGVLDRLLA